VDDIRPGGRDGNRFQRPVDFGRSAGAPPPPERRQFQQMRTPVPEQQPNRPLHQNIPPSTLNQPRRRSKKPLIIFLVLLLLAGSAGAGYWFFIRKKPTPPVQQQAAQEPVKEESTPQKTTVRIIAAGDFLPHDSINAAAKTAEGYDYLKMMKNFQPYFEKADVRFCVQGVSAGGAAAGPITGYPSFNAPVEFSRDMALLGCNVINTGTNHSNDKGQKQINATLDGWDSLQNKNIVAIAGTNRSPEEKAKIRYFTSNGLKFAFLSYVTYNNTTPETPYGVNTFDEASAKTELAEARKNADIILVSMRWGTEYSPDINPRQEQLGQFLADNGADVVFGHGQHVQGPVKRLPKQSGGETVVWYGIGNFINSQVPPETVLNGIPVVDVDIASKKISNLAFLPFYMHYEWTAAEKASEKLNARKNFMMYTFDQAVDPLSKSQNNTTIEAQTKRLTDILNKFTKVEVITPTQY
jgi:poly-gamma-glutamate capsule biosynthesis protein CapA/YwtB (metallophosphatase superfamily)